MENELCSISISAVMGALNALEQAIDELMKDTYPNTALPTPRIFKFSEWVAWPVCDGAKGKVYWKELCVDYVEDGKVVSRDRRLAIFYEKQVAVKICLDCGWEPTKVLASVRAIQEAAEWCREQYQIRCRKAREILEQQKYALETLAAEASMYKLKQAVQSGKD